jgi:hypothetical protein
LAGGPTGELTVMIIAYFQCSQRVIRAGRYDAVSAMPRSRLSFLEKLFGIHGGGVRSPPRPELELGERDGVRAPTSRLRGTALFGPAFQPARERGPDCAGPPARQSALRLRPCTSSFRAIPPPVPGTLSGLSPIHVPGTVAYCCVINEVFKNATATNDYKYWTNSSEASSNIWAWKANLNTGTIETSLKTERIGTSIVVFVLRLLIVRYVSHPRFPLCAC